MDTKRLLQILEDKDLHVHQINWRDDRDIYKAHKEYIGLDISGLSCPLDEFFIMHKADFVWLGNSMALESFIHKFTPFKQ